MKPLIGACKLIILPIMALLVLTAGSIAGDLEPPAGPDDPGSAMYTLEDVYNRLDTGVGGAKRTGGFVEPIEPPASTGRMIDEVVNKLPAADDTEGAVPADVVSGKTFWGLNTKDGKWGLQTGNQPIRFIDNGDGTVSDTQTGLMWAKTPDTTPRQYDNQFTTDWDAVAYCAKLETGNHDNWVVPHLGSLFSLIDVRNFNAVPPLSPSLPSGHPFDMGSGNLSFWTSTTATSEILPIVDIIVPWTNYYVLFDTGFTGLVQDARVDVESPLSKFRTWCVRFDN